jgi:C4-dicarboxylate transporter DctQ subunit
MIWVWLIFWGTPLSSRTKITLPLTLYLAVPLHVRRALRSLPALPSIALASVAPTWDRFAILRLKKTATLGDLFGDWIRMRDDPIYTLLVVAARYL